MAEYLEEQEKEEKEKLIRCAEFVSAIDANNKQFGVIDEPFDSSILDTNPNFDDMAHSSDEEVFDEFITNLSEMLGLIHQKTSAKNVNNNKDEINEPK
jgi:hypothetical protein